MSLKHIIRDVRRHMALGDPGSEAMDTWFCGPLFENEDLFKRLTNSAVAGHASFRRQSYKGDPAWVDTSTQAYKHGVKRLEQQLEQLMKQLRESSIPWYSYRYHGHMNWDNSLPAMVGYLAAMLYNQNNVAAEGSPVTTSLEIEVAQDLCRMVGFPTGTEEKPESWGHITCGGTVANIEAIWAARNLKLYPFAVQQALKNRWPEHDDFGITLCDGRTRKRLVDLTGWELLNIRPAHALELPDRLRKEKKLEESDLEAIDEFSVQRLGLGRFARAFHAEHGGRHAVERLAVLAPATCHYSIPKGCSLLGLGTAGMIRIKVDAAARMSLPNLEATLRRRLGRRQPVAAVIAVLGTTQEGAVDPLARVVEMRDRFRSEGLDFVIHVDAAWGGYFASLVREPPPGSASAWLLERARESLGGRELGRSRLGASLALAQLTVDRVGTADGETPHLPASRIVFTPEIALTAHVHEQLDALPGADSVTVDPHKAGFVPYPAGALCYRHRAMPRMVAFSAPIVSHGDEAPSVGTFGIEGSKPGAAAAAVWLSHRIIRPDQSGYGQVLGRSNFSAKRLFGAIVGLESDEFILRTLQDVPPATIDALRRLSDMTNEELWSEIENDPDLADLFAVTGPDLLINTFAVNFRLDDGSLNPSPVHANTFNDRVFRRLSLERVGADWPPVILTGSEYDPAVISRPFVDRFRERLEIDLSDTPMNYLITTTANPWLTDADAGRVNMVPEIARLIRETIEDVACKLRDELSQP